MDVSRFLKVAVTLRRIVHSYGSIFDFLVKICGNVHHKTWKIEQFGRSTSS